MSQPVITLTCDFGDKFAVAQMELVAHTISPSTRFLVLSNEVTEYSIVEGAFLIQKGYKFAPYGSVHIGVVDPGVGSERRGVVIKTKNAWFVGPDNGLLYPAANSDGIVNVFVINEKALGSVTNTFHGRDVFAKVAAKIVAGHDTSEFLLPTEIPLVTLDFKENQILHIDPYGNIKVNAGLEKSNNITINANLVKTKIPIVRTFADVEPGKFLAYIGSHETLEIAINQGHAASHLGLRVGEIVGIE